jgi:hypothetical protein
MASAVRLSPTLLWLCNSGDTVVADAEIGRTLWFWPTGRAQSQQSGVWTLHPCFPRQRLDWKSEAPVRDTDGLTHKPLVLPRRLTDSEFSGDAGGND